MIRHSFVTYLRMVVCSCWMRLTMRNPNILGILNSALSNGYMAFPDKQVARHKDFVAIATANTFGAGATMQVCWS
jgi:hypothetical protein